MKLLRTLIDFVGLKFEVTQYKWGRKLFKGKWYYIFPRGLSMSLFWSDQEITSCQSETITTEEYL